MLWWSVSRSFFTVVVILHEVLADRSRSCRSISELYRDMFFQSDEQCTTRLSSLFEYVVLSIATLRWSVRSEEWIEIHQWFFQSSLSLANDSLPMESLQNTAPVRSVAKLAEDIKKQCSRQVLWEDLSSHVDLVVEWSVCHVLYHGTTGTGEISACLCESSSYCCLSTLVHGNSGFVRHRDDSLQFYQHHGRLDPVQLSIHRGEHGSFHRGVHCLFAVFCSLFDEVRSVDTREKKRNRHDDDRLIFSYKLAPTFFFQRENRTLYSLKQLCSTLFHVTCSVLLLCSPCLFSSLPYLSKSALIFTVASLVSLLFSTLFLQSLLCLLGPAGQACCLLPWQCQCTRHSTSQQNKSTDVTMRKSSKGSRRHQRMSTSSHFASSYFSQIFTGSTYFESEYGGINEALVMSSRRRESSRSHQAAYAVKRASLLTGEVIELYTPRASLAPYGHHLRYSRQSSVSRGVPTTGPVRPLYISPSVSPHSQLSIHSHVAARQPSPSRSPSPHSFVRGTTRSPTVGSLRPCYSAPRLHVPLHRMQLGNLKPNNILSVETSLSPIRSPERSLMTIQRQDAVSSTDDLEQTESSPNGHLSAAMRRSLLKSTTMEAGGTVWLKRSNSS